MPDETRKDLCNDLARVDFLLDHLTSTDPRRARLVQERAEIRRKIDELRPAPRETQDESPLDILVQHYAALEGALCSDGDPDA